MEVDGSSLTLNLVNLSCGLEGDIQHGEKFFVTGEYEGELIAHVLLE